MDRISVSSECLHRARAGGERQRGAILLIVLVLVVAVGAMATGFLAIADLYARSSLDSFNRERATFAAESGISYYMARLLQDPNYFLDNPPPHSATQIGDSTFELEYADPGASDQWAVVCVGRDGDQTHRVQSVIGRGRISIPAGIVVAGTGNPSDVVLDISSDTTVGKYDPLTGNLDINIVGDAVMSVNGSLRLNSSSEIYADVNASGSLLGGNGNAIQGTLTENGLPVPVESIDSVVNRLIESSRLSNDNSVLTSNWNYNFTPAPDNAVDFFAEQGTYVLPAGTYRFRDFHIHEGARVIFDTRNGPTTIVCLGANGGTGLKIHEESSVLIEPGTTENGLLTVLGPNSNAVIDEDSVFGRITEGSDPAMSAAYSRIIGPSETSAAHLKIEDDSTIYGHLHTAGHELTLGRSSWYGSGVVRSATLRSSRFILTSPEESSSATTGQGDYQVVAQWTPSPEEMAIDALIRDTEALALPLSLENNLTDKLVTSRNRLAQGNTTSSVNRLGAFVNQVNAKRGAGLTNAQADALSASANAIISAIQAT